MGIADLEISAFRILALGLGGILDFRDFDLS
jgi:hypothetical protein